MLYKIINNAYEDDEYIVAEKDFKKDYPKDCEVVFAFKKGQEVEVRKIRVGKGNKRFKYLILGCLGDCSVFELMKTDLRYYKLFSKEDLEKIFNSPEYVEEKKEK